MYTYMYFQLFSWIIETLLWICDTCLCFYNACIKIYKLFANIDTLFLHWFVCKKQTPYTEQVLGADRIYTTYECFILPFKVLLPFKYFKSIYILVLMLDIIISSVI